MENAPANPINTAAVPAPAVEPNQIVNQPTVETPSIDWSGTVNATAEQVKSENVFEQMFNETQPQTEDEKKYEFQRLREIANAEQVDKQKLATEIANYEAGFRKVYTQKVQLEQEMNVAREQVSELVNAITPLSQAIMNRDVNAALAWLAQNGLDLSAMGTQIPQTQSNNYEGQNVPALQPQVNQSEIEAQELKFKYEVTPKIVNAVAEKLGWQITPQMVEVAYKAFPNLEVLEALKAAYPQEWQRFEQERQAQNPTANQLRTGERVVGLTQGKNPFNPDSQPKQYVRWELMNGR